MSCLPQHREGSGEAKGAEGLLRGSRCPEPWYSSREPSVRSKQGSKERELRCGSQRTFPSLINRSATRPWNDVHRGGPPEWHRTGKGKMGMTAKEKGRWLPHPPCALLQFRKEGLNIRWMTPAELSTFLWCVHVCVCVHAGICHGLSQSTSLNTSVSPLRCRIKLPLLLFEMAI